MFVEHTDSSDYVLSQISRHDVAVTSVYEPQKYDDQIFDLLIAGEV